MHKLPFILLFLLSYVTMHAQDTVAAYPLVTDTITRLSLPPTFVGIWEDKSKKASLDVVTNGSQATAFQLLSTQTATRWRPGVYWLHYRLRNAAQKPLTVALSSAAYFATCFTRQGGGGWVKKETGLFRPWREKDGSKKESSIPYTLAPGEELDVYQREHYWQQVPGRMGVALQFPQAIALERYTQEQNATNAIRDANTPLSAMIAGILLFSAIIYWRFFRIVRVRFYLYYALFLFCFSLMYSPIGNLLQPFPMVDLYASYTPFVAGLLFFTQFFRHYLRTPVNYPNWDKWLLFAGCVPLVIFMFNYVLVGLLPRSVSFFFLIWGSRSFVLVLDSLLITTLLYAGSRKASAGVVATIPALLVWGLGQTYKMVYNLLNSGSSQQPPALIRWMNENTYLIDLICIVWIVSVFSSLLFQRFAHLQKQVVRQAVKNERLKRQKEKERSELIARQKAELEQQVEKRTQELKQSLENLKATQSQLIQAEKMASLGELTAGVAHEIQNPLNFITNFSESSIELLAEMKQEANDGNTPAVLSLASDLEVNLSKVMKHGKRADSIVKAMLQHSRSTAGFKEPTDINSLADEFFRLSYHGFRAINKSFNTAIHTDFDPSIGLVNLVSQDVGRVLLNLFNNAFYAVNEKKKRLGAAFEPAVWVKTCKAGEKIAISIRDNGTGIPQKVLEKIYQPFFTTKPSGEGTGLGLSLSYDIITKGHGGEMTVETREGEFTEFTIRMPQGVFDLEKA